MVNTTATQASTMTFSDLSLSSSLLNVLHEKLGYTHPSPIQEKAIPWLLEGRDLIGQAQTGTGKTAAFAIPALERIDLNQRVPQILVLAPTRELAIQVAEHFDTLSSAKPGVNAIVLCGGQDYRPQLKALKDGAQIVVGTPGRILDHLEKGSLKLHALKTLVLDEADEMLRMGFIDDVEMILSKIPQEKQTALFSATMPFRIRQIAQRYLNDPVSIEIKNETATVKAIEQRFVFVSGHQKLELLWRVLATEETQGVIVFTKTKTSTDEVATFLQKQGHRAMAIHGDITQALRERVIQQFREGGIDILVATDVAARGLDVDRVSHVINYDMAHDAETYVHRIGRTGRAGRSGIAILFVTPKEGRILNMVERHTRQRMVKMLPPTDEQVHVAKQQRLLQELTTRLHHPLLQEYQQMIVSLMRDQAMEPLDVAAALALMLHHDKPWRQKLAPLHREEQHVKSRARREDTHADRFSRRDRVKEGRERPSSYQKSRDSRDVRDSKHYRQDQVDQELFRIDVGRIHGVKPGNIVGAIANEAGLQSKLITGLRIHDDHSLVRLPRGLSKEIHQGLSRAWVCGRQLKLTSLGSA